MIRRLNMEEFGAPRLVFRNFPVYGKGIQGRVRTQTVRLLNSGLEPDQLILHDKTGNSAVAGRLKWIDICPDKEKQALRLDIKFLHTLHVDPRIKSDDRKDYVELLQNTIGLIGKGWPDNIFSGSAGFVDHQWDAGIPGGMTFLIDISRTEIWRELKEHGFAVAHIPTLIAMQHSAQNDLNKILEAITIFPAIDRPASSLEYLSLIGYNNQDKLSVSLELIFAGGINIINELRNIKEICKGKISTLHLPFAVTAGFDDPSPQTSVGPTRPFITISQIA